MRIKLGPVEIEQDPIKDDVLYNEYKESPKTVEKYLAEKSKFLDLSLKNIIAGKTMKMIIDFVFTIAGGIAFVGWALYVFYISKDSFVWKEMGLETFFSVILQAILIIVICFLPVILVAGCFMLTRRIRSKKEETQKDKAEK